MTQAERDIKRKLRIFKHAEESGNVSNTCRYFGISRSTYYGWKQRYAQILGTIWAQLLEDELLRVHRQHDFGNSQQKPGHLIIDTSCRHIQQDMLRGLS